MAMASALQDYAATVSRSGSKRLDAELCLLQLADESLSGDFSSLLSRMDRLEEQLRRGVPAAAPAASAPLRPAEPESMPASFSISPAKPKAAKSVPADLPPWETDAPPLPEEPPFATDAPPLPAEPPFFAEEPPLPEEPPLRGEPVFSAAPSAPEPVFAVRPAKKAEPAAAGDTEVWRDLLEHYKNRISPMCRAFLNMASGSLEGDLLTVLCDTELTKEKLSDEAVATVLREVTSAHMGKQIRLQFQVGKAETKQGSVNDLIALGNQFGGFTIK